MLTRVDLKYNLEGNKFSNIKLLEYHFKDIGDIDVIERPVSPKEIGDLPIFSISKEYIEYIGTDCINRITDAFDNLTSRSLMFVGFRSFKFFPKITRARVVITANNHSCYDHIAYDLPNSAVFDAVILQGDAFPPNKKITNSNLIAEVLRIAAKQLDLSVKENLLYLTDIPANFKKPLCTIMREYIIVALTEPDLKLDFKTVVEHGTNTEMKNICQFPVSREMFEYAKNHYITLGSGASEGSINQTSFWNKIRSYV